MATKENHLLRPLVVGWMSAIERARTCKKEFTETAKECSDFFGRSYDFMWKDDYLKKLGKGVNPRFKMTMMKAFEFVALYGPTLYHRNPIRRVNPRSVVDFDPSLMMGMMGDAGGMPQDPNAQMMQQMMMQQIMMTQQFTRTQDKSRAELLEAYLNYSPNEMPGGGLAAHSMMAIAEALIKGRGLLWSRPHRPPGANHLLIVSEYDSVDNLFIDPDATSLHDALWVAQKCQCPTWQVEKDYGWERGSLKSKGSLESGTSEGLSQGDDENRWKRDDGEADDIMTYYKIYSRMGIGARLTGVKDDLAKKLDDLLGDYSYLAVCNGVPCPLNMQDKQLLTDDEEVVRESFSWPIPYYADERWPFTELDFYKEPNNPWPIAPLKPGLGELKFLNVMVSSLANRIWTSSRDFMAVWKGASEELKKAMEKGDDLTIIPVDLQEKVNEAVTFLTQPQTNKDVWTIIDAVMQIFEKRVGLNEILYGISQRADRSASETTIKQERANTRVDDMAEKTEKFMTETARHEGFCMRWFLTGEDVAPALGQLAGHMWDQLVVTDDVDRIVREFEYRVEASSAKKQTMDKKNADLNAILPMVMPFFQQLAGMGNVEPFNSLMSELGKSMQMDTERMLLQPAPPPMPMPEQQAVEQGPPQGM